MRLSPPSDSRCARVSLIALGAGAMATQLVLLREVLSTFGGNELITGAALGLWLLLTGVGSMLGGRIRPRSPRLILASGHCLIATLPQIQLVAFRALPLLFIRGEKLGWASGLAGCLVIFLPFAFVSGAMIPLAARLLSSKGAARGAGEASGGGAGKTTAGGNGEVTRSATGHGAQRVYALDAAGSAAGGLLFSLLLAGACPHGWSLALFGWLNLGAAGLLALGTHAAPLWLSLLLGVALLSAGRLDRWSLAWRFPGQQLLRLYNTPFGQLAVTRSGQQVNVLEDAVPFYSTGDLTAEARVHPALCQVPPGAHVLLIGGGRFGSIREVAKYAPARVDYVEMDPRVLGLDLPDRSPGADPPDPSGDEAGRALYEHAGDGRRFLAGRPSQYDVILVDLPGPVNAQLNRFYTEEFFRLAARALRRDGVLSFPLAATPNYLGQEQLALERSIYAALARIFSHLEVLAGDTHIYLASNRPLDLDIPSLINARGIATQRLLDYDWSDLADPFQRDELTRQLTARPPPAPPNQDLAPRAFAHLLDLEARKSGASRALVWILALLSLLAAALATRGRRVALAIASTGFAAMGLELVVLLLFQVMFGYLYLRLSLFVTLFLIGASLGAALTRAPASRSRTRLRTTDAALVAAPLLTAGVAWWAASSSLAVAGWIGQGVLSLLILGIAALAGAQFAAAGVLRSSERVPPTRGGRQADIGTVAGGGPAAPQVVADLYLADLVGSASGAIWTGLILLPKTGVIGVCIILVLLKAALHPLLWRRAA